MTLFSFHLVKTNTYSAFKATLFPPKPKNIKGLIHAERMTSMTLGSNIFSPQRLLIRQVAVFAQWENETALEHFLEHDNFGKTLSTGWHTRLRYLRQWGEISEITVPTESQAIDDPQSPVVGFTLARMKLLQVPRFLKWGKPVEKLVRDHPGTTLALAAIRLPNTVSTFSVWTSQKEMTDMVHGHSKVDKPKRHADAMKERKRKNFHYEFTTLRFKPISEHGKWNGEQNLIPGLKINHI